MRLIHYSAEPLGEPRSVSQENSIRYFKPNGLWVSVEEEDREESFGWLEWCEGEQWGLDGFEHAAEIFLASGSNLLRVNGAVELLAFAERYKLAGKWSRYDEVRWHDVAKDYQGIIIAPYVYSLRLDDRVNWYYAWDCASGCIWDMTAIERVAPLAEFRKPKRGEEAEAA